MSKASNDIQTERQRQKSVEGWTPAHDDGHDTGDLAVFAACYALSSAGWKKEALWEIAPRGWVLKPADARRDLVKAGALILAEIERLDRLGQLGECSGALVIQDSTQRCSECGDYAYVEDGKGQQ